MAEEIKRNVLKDCSKFSMKNFKIGKFVTPTKGAQNSAKIQYDFDGVEDNLIFRLPWIKLNVHGIPKKQDSKDATWVQTPESREHIKIPIHDEVNKELKPFVNMANEITKKLNNSQWKAEQFGSAEEGDMHKALEILRYPPKPRKVDGKAQYPKKASNFEQIDRLKVKYLKAKFNYVYPKDENDKKSKKKNDEDDEDEDSDGASKKKGKKGKKDDAPTEKQMATIVVHRLVDSKGNKTSKTHYPKTVDEIYELIPYGSEIRPYVMFPKLWEMQVEELGTIKFGPMFKLLLIEVKPRVSSSKPITVKGLMGSDSEDDDEPKKKLSGKKEVKKETKKKPESDDDEEEVPKKKPSKKTASDDDEEEEAPKKKPVKKAASDDDEEEEAPKKKPSKKQDEEEDDDEAPKKKPAKKVETDDEEEEEAPKKKPAKKVESDDEEEEED